MTRGWSFALKLVLTGAVLAGLAATVDLGAMGPALAGLDFASRG